MPINTAQDAVGDVNALKRLERFGGSKLRAEITLLFLQEAPSRIASARAALDAGNIEGVRSVAHMLKSSAGQMGALGMQKLCEQLESPEHSPNLSLLLTDLDHELVRYIAWLETAPQAGAPT
ncbi:MAG TPA: Hpt domain-containing protein [Gemmatimonadaceae bacterium]|nr:Hpt domain-containing protein [Gemmatimonadaceae bacterium]